MSDTQRPDEPPMTTDETWERHLRHQRPDERVEAIRVQWDHEPSNGLMHMAIRDLLAAYDEQRARAERADALNLTLAQAIERTDTELHHGMPDLALETLREAHGTAMGDGGAVLLERLERAEADVARLENVIEFIRTYDPVAVDDAEKRYPDDESATP